MNLREPASILVLVVFPLSIIHSTNNYKDPESNEFQGIFECFEFEVRTKSSMRPCFIDNIETDFEVESG